MKLSLRKASALQNTIQDHIKAIGVNTTIQLNEFQDVQESITKAQTELSKNDGRRMALQSVLFKIRSAVGRANVESGVADLLTQAAYVDKRLAHLKGFTETKVMEDITVLRGKVGKLKESNGERRIYGYNDTIETSILSAEMIETYKVQSRELKKEKQTINDKVLELNVRTEITLEDSDVALLQSEQLI